MSKSNLHTFTDDGIEFMTLTLEQIETLHGNIKLCRLSPWEDPTEEKKVHYAKRRREIKLQVLEFILKYDRLKRLPDYYHEVFKNYIVDIFEAM